MAKDKRPEDNTLPAWAQKRLEHQLLNNQRFQEPEAKDNVASDTNNPQPPRPLP